MLDRILRAFALSAVSGEASTDARSGAGVRRVRTIDGRPAYLKVTPAGLGTRALEAARRELAFYRTLRPAVPVRTPELLRSDDTDEGVALLLTDEGRPVDVEAWSPSSWAELGRQLAALHSIDLPEEPVWRRPDPLLSAMNAPDVAGLEAFWAQSLPELPSVLDAADELAAQACALPPVFTHGDCHTGNVLLSRGRLSLCDWQAAGIGRPVSDLAFPAVRATPSGVAVPRGLVASYAAHRSVDPHELGRALVAEELAVLVYLWPPFAAYNSPTSVGRIRARARELVRQWATAREEGP